MHLPLFQNANVLVVGDIMLDRYWHGASTRISPEAPVPVVKVEQHDDRPGGAGNVALNIASLGAKVTLIGFVGEDEAANTLRTRLDAAGVANDLLSVPGATTITKLRVVSRQQQLIRLDFEQGFFDADHTYLLQVIEKHMASAGVVILSDYAKGVLASAEPIIKLAKKHKIPVLVDPKGRDFSRYHGATLVTPNLHEFETIVGSCPREQDLIEKGLKLLREHQWQSLLITRGEHGMTLLRDGEAELHLPARAREVYDVTGAGDTVIATLAAALAAGEALPEATALANLAAGIVVGKLGAAPITVPELRRAAWSEHHSGRGVLSEEQLLIARLDARAHGEKVVMTNGCFDILHAGHVAYLEQAKKLGGRLVVAVNNDASVQRLKGNGRPVNTLERRMAVLAGLEAVDWVVSFSEDTPERLIASVLPDVLVKGGDYRVEDIAGAKAVLAQGGEVRVLEFVPDCSTSAIIRAIKQ